MGKFTHVVHSFLIYVVDTFTQSDMHALFLDSIISRPWSH